MKWFKDNAIAIIGGLATMVCTVSVVGFKVGIQQEKLSSLEQKLDEEVKPGIDGLKDAVNGIKVQQASMAKDLEHLTELMQSRQTRNVARSIP